MTGKVQEPLVSVAFEHGLVVETQLNPERLQVPSVQVAVAEPEKPVALFVVEVLCVCDRPLTGKVQEPPFKVALAQPTGSLTQEAPL